MAKMVAYFFLRQEFWCCVQGIWTSDFQRSFPGWDHSAHTQCWEDSFHPFFSLKAIPGVHLGNCHAGSLYLHQARTQQSHHEEITKKVWIFWGTKDVCEIVFIFCTPTK